MERLRLGDRHFLVAVGTLCLIAGLSACGHPAVSARALRSYVQSVEPIRRDVNRLLDGADPVLDGYREHRITPAQAVDAMTRLERRFERATVTVNALHPSDPRLRGVNTPYARTYLLEDAYLRALAAALPGRDYSRLPRTQSVQRAAIIHWRTQVEALARRTGVHLPDDFRQAGRGEIAPAPDGDS